MKTPIQRSPSLHVLVFREDDLWCAQCVEYDIAGQGRTAEDAVECFKAVLLAEVKLNEGDLSHIPRAPREFSSRLAESGASAHQEPPGPHVGSGRPMPGPVMPSLVMPQIGPGERISAEVLYA